ncbi:MAG: tyrosine--tRNA ligase, partial [Nanoarchaeota archaeon]|nr:tyrosine--tRNA ligase [Nanoarchaeota archaeon]
MNIDEKIKIIREVGEEIINEDDLRKLLEKVSNPIAYDGFEPSGQIHIAQGLLRAINVNKLTSTGIRFKFWVADYFAMLNNKYGGDIDKIRVAGEYAIEVWKSCGMDLKNVEFVWASEFFKNHPEYWETVLKLAMNSTISRVMKCGQIMGREESTSNPSAQILYPLMQAADIIHLEANIAQLGLDQRKVNMLARDIFPKIGKRKPVCIHHHMLLSLQSDGKDLEGVD